MGVLIFGYWIWMWWEEFKMISVILETAPTHHCLRARGEFNLFNFSSKRTENHFSNYQNTNLFFLWDVSSGLKLCLWLKTLYIRRNLFKNKFFWHLLLSFLSSVPPPQLANNWQFQTYLKCHHPQLPKLHLNSARLKSWKSDKIISIHTNELKLNFAGKFK